MIPLESVVFSSFGKLKCLAVSFVGINVNKTGLTEQKSEFFDACQFIFEFVKGVNGEIGGNNGESRTVLDFISQKIGDGAVHAVVLDAGGFRHCIFYRNKSFWTWKFSFFSDVSHIFGEKLLKDVSFSVVVFIARLCEI